MLKTKITSDTGIVRGILRSWLMVPVLLMLLLMSVILTDNEATYATSSSISISITGSPIVIVNPSEEGKFADSGDFTIGVQTTHASGYTFSIKAAGETNPTQLNGNTTEGAITSIDTAISADTFRNNSDYNDKWGYKPSVYYNSSTKETVINDNYLPSPSVSGDILDVTENADDGSYTMSIGARVSTATEIDTYSNVFVFVAVANPTPYTITYNTNTTDTVTNMPENVTDGEANTESVNISNTVPVRSGYDFVGWCTVAVADGGSCSGATYNPGGTYTLDQTASNNELVVYAMWKVDIVVTACTTPIPNVGITYMQDITSSNKSTVLSNMAQNTQYALMDNRDNKSYCVAKLADGNIWMTQNLDLEIGGEGVAPLTSENTNLTTSGSGVYATDYSTSGGVITWSPTASTLTGSPAQITNFASGSPANSVTGWTNNMNVPYMAEGGDHYVYTSGVANTSVLDTIYSSAEECTTTGGHSAEECAHYHVGNYYNWTAAIASSASSSISTNYSNATNSICPKGWKLPSGSASSDTSTTRQFGYLWQQTGITSSLTATSYATDGFLNIRQTPLFFARGGYVGGTKFSYGASLGRWWSSTVGSKTDAYNAQFTSTTTYSASNSYRELGYSLRCLVQ